MNFFSLKHFSIVFDFFVMKNKCKKKEKKMQIIFEIEYEIYLLKIFEYLLKFENIYYNIFVAKVVCNRIYMGKTFFFFCNASNLL